jgi:hypothetical protein
VNVTPTRAFEPVRRVKREVAGWIATGATDVRAALGPPPRQLG